MHFRSTREKERERCSTAATVVGNGIGRRSRHFPDVLPSFFFSFVYKAIITSVILNSGSRCDLYGRRASIHYIIKSHIHTAESIRRAYSRAARTCSSRQSGRGVLRSPQKSRMTMLLRRPIVSDRRLFTSPFDSSSDRTRCATSATLVSVLSLLFHNYLHTVVYYFLL